MDRFCSGIEHLVIDYLGATFTVGSQLNDGSHEDVYRQILNILELELAPARPRRVGVTSLRVAMFVAENAWSEILTRILQLPRIYDGYIDEIVISAASSGSVATLNIALFEVFTRKKESPNIGTIEKAMIEAVKVNSVEELKVLSAWVTSGKYSQSSRRWTWQGTNYYTVFSHALTYNRPEIYSTLQKMFRRVPLEGRCKLIRLAGLSGNRPLVQMCLLHTRMAENPRARGFAAIGAIEGGHLDLAREAIGESKIEPLIWRMFDTAVMCGRKESLKLILQMITPDQLKQRQLQKSAWSAFLILQASQHEGMLECLAECGVLNDMSLKRVLNRVRSHHMSKSYNKERLNQWIEKSTLIPSL